MLLLICHISSTFQKYLTFLKKIQNKIKIKKNKKKNIKKKKKKKKERKKERKKDGLLFLEGK